MKVAGEPLGFLREVCRPESPGVDAVKRMLRERGRGACGQANAAGAREGVQECHKSRGRLLNRFDECAQSLDT
jgi:hypothetical protein